MPVTELIALSRSWIIVTLVMDLVVGGQTAIVHGHFLIGGLKILTTPLSVCSITFPVNNRVFDEQN